MKSLTKTLNNFNNRCPITKQKAPCIARKIHREKEGFEKYTRDDIYQSPDTKDVNHFRRKSAPELPPIPERFISASTCRRYSVDYFSNSSSKSFIEKSRGSGRSSSSSPVYDSNNNNDNNGTHKLFLESRDTCSDAECDQHKTQTMSGAHKKENKKYRPRLLSKEHSTLSKNNSILNNNINKSSPEKQTQEALSPFGQLTRPRTFTKTTKKKSRGQKRSTKTSFNNNRTLSIENIDQITRSKTLDNEMFGMRRSTSTHALDTKPVSVTVIKTEEHENGNIEGSSDPDSDSEFDDYILNWIKNVESAGLEPPPDPKIDYTDEPLQKDTALHIVHDS